MEIYFYSFLAGLIGTFSPCVIPVIPIVITSSLNVSKIGPIYLFIGMILSFTVFGFLVARIGNEINIFQEDVSQISSSLMILFGLMLVFEFHFLKERLSIISNSFSKIFDSLDHKKSLSQFYLGLLLGGIWSPCTGPSLGVAISLASSQKESIKSLIIMLVYAIGSGIPILIIAYGMRNYFKRNLSNLTSISEKIKKIFGIIILVSGIIIFSHLDKYFEYLLIQYLPDSYLQILTKW
ncbi:MAG: cytochrome c biogenesis CcdA family protein [Leptospiraceae bacterium]|nr:cytochrome c biogenesis CcdA family protein [Leptospiraceae bacterium]